MTIIAATPDVSADQPVAARGGGLAWTAFIALLLARAFRALLVTLLVVSAIPVVSSWSGYVVRSASMEPGMSTGDVIVAQPLDPQAPIPVGRVMVFDNPDRASSHRTMVHRVVENLGQGQYTTAGDANRDNDSTPAAAADFTARPTLSVPYIGLPLTWWAARDLVPLTFWLLLIGLTLYFSARPPGDPRHRRRRELHGATVLVPLIALGAAVVISPPADAEAAFSARTHDRGNTWTVSKGLSTTIVLGQLPSVVRGTVPVTATLKEPSGRAFSVTIQYRAAGTSTWRTLCTDAAAPYACTWATTTTSSGDYDLQAVATSGSTVYTSVPVTDIRVDNTAPSTTMQDPGTPLKGTVTVTAAANDQHSGVASVVIQYAAAGSTTFRDICTATSAPYSCRFDSTTAAAGTYSFRSVATDVAGSSTTSVVVTGRVIDNSYATVAMDPPGNYIGGTVVFKATAAASAGVRSVRMQFAPAGTTSWVDVCTDTTTPYTCTVNTFDAADGAYDIRAIMLDGSGRSTTSATVTTRVDNNPIRAYGVETANGGFISGRLENRDSMTLTYSERVGLGSILAGWTGSPVAVTVRLRDGAVTGLTGNDDTVTVLRNGSAVNLGSVNLKQNYIQSQSTAEFAATMTTSTTTVDGVAATRIVLTMGAQTSGPTPSTVSTSSVMVWTPSTLVTDLNGRPVSSTPVSESGTSDRQF
jgi:signal peptidase I